jgi:aminoglycoside-2''-adenylyltransferase
MKRCATSPRRLMMYGMADADASRGAWQPASVAEVAAIFSALETPWWIAGGCAIELAVGHDLRDHGDIDVVILRKDHLGVRQLLRDWQCWAADPPGALRPWLPGETLSLGVHDIWCRPGEGDPWRIQVMLDESVGEDWVSRRDSRIRRRISSLGLVNEEQVPYLAPEIQLFYKAKEPRPKDELDFEAVLPLLGIEQREWLRASIQTCYSEEHPWRERLRL